MGRLITSFPRTDGVAGRWTIPTNVGNPPVPAPGKVFETRAKSTWWENIHRWRGSLVAFGCSAGRRFGLWVRFGGDSSGVMSGKAWDAQYSAGHWARLRDLTEVPHNSVIVGLLQFLKPNAAVLDVGCGEGVLCSALGPYRYRRYLGLDVSTVAIAAVAGLADERTAFIATDAETYVPSESFDAIIFNESLYYLRDPLAVLRRYARHLAPDGILVVSIFHESARTQQLFQDAKRGMSVVADVTVTTQGAVWGVLALAAGRK